MSKCFIIAEAGVNHNGVYDNAVRLVNVAADAGVDAVKFQTFQAEKLVTASALKAGYQVTNTGNGGSQYEMLKQLEMPNSWHFDLRELCEKRGIEFISTPFDIDSLHFLVRDLDVKRLKIGSGEIGNAPLLYQAGLSRKQIILSTGMASLQEIRLSLGAFLCGALELVRPTLADFERVLLEPHAMAILLQRVCLLQCTTSYPTPIDQINLRVMETLRQEFGTRVGFSDHSDGIIASTVAVAMGASVIEKHFTLDREMDGPDHLASIEPDELNKLVEEIRASETIMGNAEKFCSPLETGILSAARKSLVLLADVEEGETFTEDNLGVMRPGGGVSPIHYWEVLGTKAKRNFKKHDLLNL